MLSSVVFVLSIIPASYVFGWSRLFSGSVWPAVVAHAAWNSIIQGVFDASTVGSSAAQAKSVWIGESGLLVAATSAAIALLILQRASGSLVLKPRPSSI
jgi:uncharacterized protein